MKVELAHSLRRSIKEPIPAIFQAWDLLSSAADALLRGERLTAEALFGKANMPEVWHWTNPAQGPSPLQIRLNVRVWKPDGDTHPIPKLERDLQRHPTPKVKAAVLSRDGYRCRYCGIPVIEASTRKIACRIFPNAIPWIDGDEARQHAAFQCFWFQYDHVVPYSHGGSSSEENIVVTCALCNYGKDQYTLRQLGISDPRLRAPEPNSWDGLKRLGQFELPPRPRHKASSPKSDVQLVRTQEAAQPPKRSANFFLPGAWISKGYLFTPPIAGKERWFKLGPKVIGEPEMRDSVGGCRLICDPAEFRRRGLAPDEFLDQSLPSSPT